MPPNRNEEAPFLSLMVMSDATYDDQPLRRRLRLTLLEIVVGLGLTILIGLLGVALWSFLALPVAPSA